MLANPRRCLTHAEIRELLRRTHREAMARRQRQLEADFREWFVCAKCGKPEGECGCGGERKT